MRRRHALTTPAPTPRLITRFAIQHATQSQAARHAAKTLVRMFMRDVEKLVATGPTTRPARKNFLPGGCMRWPSRGAAASADAAGPLTQPLTITLRLFATLLLAVLGRAILLARLPTPPAPSRLPTRLTAIMRSPMPRPEQPFAALEQTPPGPIMTALWPLADVPKKMTLVHGRRLLPLFKSRSEASTSLRGVSLPTAAPRYLSFAVKFTKRSHPALRPRRPGPGHGATFGPLSERC